MAQRSATFQLLRIIVTAENLNSTAEKAILRQFAFLK
jgi:hypothetical protein